MQKTGEEYNPVSSVILYLQMSVWFVLLGRWVSKLTSGHAGKKQSFCEFSFRRLAGIVLVANGI